jgi:mannose-1-phosphate guanylyltransferase
VDRAPEEESRNHTGRLKAVILAGGTGTRGRPFTEYFPKAMIPVDGIPLIHHIIRYLSSWDIISEIVIVADINGLGGQIKGYYNGSGKNIRFVQDSASGTAGDLLHLENIIKNEPFILWFTDNLGAIDIKKMYNHFVAKKSLACIATRRYRKEETGFAKVRDGKVLEFIEKPIVRMKDCECTGIYVLSPEIIKMIKRKEKRKKSMNLSFDILQDLSKRGLVSSFDIGRTDWLDVESPTVLERQKEVVKKIVSLMNQA